MIEDYLSEPRIQRSVETPEHSSEDGGGHRFVFYGGGPGEKRGKANKKKIIEAPVKLDLSGGTLASDIVLVHSDEQVKKKVGEFTEKIMSGEFESVKEHENREGELSELPEQMELKEGGGNE